MIPDFVRSLLRKPEFPSGTLPWTDCPDFESQLKRRMISGALTVETADAIRSWNRDGFLIWRGAVDPGLLDALLDDYETAWRERPACHLAIAGRGTMRWEDAGDRGRSHHFRILDFHNLSDAAAEVLMYPAILDFMKMLFEDTPVGMQTLFFEYGSEQDFHQDFVYVHADIPSHLAAAWVACEDADETNGPLLYYPGSHRIPKYDFGGGRGIYNYKNPDLIPQYSRYLEQTCERMGLKPDFLHVKKGDVILWHAALVHRGSRVLDTGRTRKSFVSHYSHLKAYPRERRLPGRIPRRREVHGGVYYEWEAPGHQEGRYPLRLLSPRKGSLDV